MITAAIYARAHVNTMSSLGVSERASVTAIGGS